jgi:peptide/nickel transport system permease protein
MLRLMKVRAWLQRLGLLVVTLWLVSSLVFLLLHLLPGDPVVAMLGERASPSDLAALRASLGLDRPLWVQYGAYWQGLWHGDLGQSLIGGKPVGQLMLERLPATGVLAAAAMLVALVVGLGLAVLGAQARGVGRWLGRTTSLGLMATPSFVLGPLLMLLLAVVLGWLPVSGTGSLAHLVLPAVTLGLGLAAVVGRMGAATLEEVRHTPMVRTVAAKGASSRRQWWHAARNTALPLVQVVCLQAGMVLTGAVLTETIFGWPGLGNLLVEALNTRDYPVIQGCLLVISVTYVLALALADALAHLLDPRLRTGGRA